MLNKVKITVKMDSNYTFATGASFKMDGLKSPSLSDNVVKLKRYDPFGVTYL